MRRPMPRDAGGSIEITEGTGPILAMVSTGELLELFKVDKTFRVQTPESIDPERTNPNVPFTVSTVQNVGTSNQIVSRVLLQGSQVLGMFAGTQGEKHAILKQLHKCKELLLRCEAYATQVREKIRAIVETLETTGVPTGRVLKPFPHTENLESDCSLFLVEANRAIRAISGLPSLFIQLERTDKNFDHLGERLAKQIGPDQAVTEFVKSVAVSIRRLVDLRNYLEHPNGRRTIINNFQLLPDGQLRSPTWHLSGEDPIAVDDDMFAMINFLVRVSEKMLIHLVLYKGKERLAFRVQEIPDDQMDRQFPVKYKLTAYLKPYQKPPGGSR